MTTARRGWIKIYPSQEAGKWEVYDFSENGDSGHLVGVFDNREAAILAGQKASTIFNRKMLLPA